MKNITSRINSILNRYKFSDMPAIPGEVHWGNRGLEWKRFDIYHPDIEVPLVLSNMLVVKSNSFKKEFSKYVGMDPDQFGGMIFAIYAHDTILTDEMQQELRNIKLDSTIDFIKKTSIKLSTLDEEKNRDKQIGSDWWFSWYGYAYENLFPDKINNIGRPKPAQLRALTQEKEKKYSHGPLVVLPTRDNGFGIFIDTGEDGIPIYWGQSTGSLKKIFKGDIELNKSRVYVDNGIIVPATKPKTKHLTEHEKNKIINDYNSVVKDISNLWKIGIDTDGTIYIYNKEERQNLDADQIYDLLLDSVKKSSYFKKGDSSSDRSYGSGPYEVEEDAKEIIRRTDESFGIKSLREVRRLSEEKYGRDYHTPYEGWKVIFVGPKFSIAKNIGEGQAIANPRYVVPENQVAPGEISQGEYLSVLRGHSWEVLANEFSPQRDKKLAASVRAKGKAKSQDFDNPQDAMSYLSSIYLGMSEGEVDSSSTNVLEGIEEDIKRADEALLAAEQQKINNFTNTPMTQNNIDNSNETLEIFHNDLVNNINIDDKKENIDINSTSMILRNIHRAINNKGFNR